MTLNESELIRSFISISPNDVARRALVKLQRRLRVQIPDSVMRWTVPEHMHLTLVFLGDIEPVCLNGLDEQLRRIARKFEPIDLWAENVGAFPKFEKPNLVFAKVSARRNMLCDLQCELSLAARQFSTHEESRPFNPHLTLARVRRGQFRQARNIGSFLKTVNITEVVAWRASRFQLMKSDLSGKSPVYSCLREYELDKSY